MKKNLDITKPRYSKQILPVPWPFVIWRFHCSTSPPGQKTTDQYTETLSVISDGFAMSRAVVNFANGLVVALSIYLFIYLFINFAKRLGSLTEQAPLRGPEKKEHFNTTNKNDNNLETTKKKKKRNGNAKRELGRTSIKINNTHD